jgi:serine/threonine protein kinase
MPLRTESGSEPIAGYRLIDRLGGGGFGEVWSAQAPDGRLVAVKIVHGDLAATGDRTAEQELQALRRVLPVRHPFLLPVERYDVIDGRLVIVSPLADGDIAGRLRACRGQGLPGIPRDELLRHLAEAAEALDALRAAHLQHLDVKPQNLLLIDGHVAVGDFGLVRDLRSGRPGTAASPAYSAPETFAGNLSPHCDQYGLAVVYQELLTGVRPFAGTTPEQLAHQHLAVAPNITPLPPADRAAVSRALAKKPSERFPTCRAFVAALTGETTEDRGQRTEDSKSSRLSTVLGPLSPVLVIGVGGIGGTILRQLRRLLAEQIGPPDRWPVRLLYIDTDPDATRTIVESDGLDPAAVLPTRLQRADHYPKPRSDGKTSGPLPWLDPKWLNRLSTATVPRGCRGLGRLAFADHVRALGQKIETDLAAVTRARAGRPRIVIVAGLAGGTGGGMAIDLAFLAQHLLRRFGDAAAVTGWLLLPPAEGDDRAVANAFAALAEVRYFDRPDTTYRARCDDPPDSLTTRDAPFAEVVVLPLSDIGIRSAADGLIRELLSRAEQPVAKPDECRTFGQTRFAWPRRAILRHAARQLAGDLVERWTGGEAAAVGGSVRAWVMGQWSALELGPEALTKRLQQAAETALGRPIEAAFAAVAGPATLLRSEAAPDVLGRLDGLLTRLGSTLAAATDRLVREAGTRLARLAVTLVEQPDFRLAGAEAAVRLLAEQLDRALAHAGPAADERFRKADAARSSAADPAEAVRSYPRLRYQGLLMRQVAAVYAVLRGQVADELAEVGLCRTRLVAVLDALRVEQTATAPAGLLLPPGCATVAEAASQLMTGAEDVRDLDRRAQQYLTDTVGGLARACLTTVDLPRTLGPALVELAETFVEPRLNNTGPGDLFLSRHPGEEAVTALRAAWTTAAPAFAAAAEVTTVVAPDSFADLARQAFGANVALTTSADEVTVIRSVVHFPLASLPQLGPMAKAAYQRRKAAGDSPHARLDIAASG